jgi:hypothetical protein
VYPTPDHAPATHTNFMFQVDDIEAAVGELAKRDVQFERYDGMDQDERPAAAARSSPRGSRTRPETFSRGPDHSGQCRDESFENSANLVTAA